MIQIKKMLIFCKLAVYKIQKKYSTGESLAGFIDGLVDKLFFTVIEVSDQINAFKVFETLNARGVQLSSSDLLKNYLFSVVDENKPHISEIEELEKIWSKIVGKLGENKFEDYLRYYWNSFNKTVSKKNLFKTIKNNIKSREKVFELIRDLMQKADAYLAIQTPDDIFWKDSPCKLATLQLSFENSQFVKKFQTSEVCAI